jgi:hypothetical protein
MPRNKTAALVLAEKLETSIHIIRGQRVILDSDIATLYGVPTKAVNQAVERNPERFPVDFAFQLTDREIADLASVIAIANKGRGRNDNPHAFTEHGVVMLSSVLRSPTATQVSIALLRYLYSVCEYAQNN